MYIFLNKIGINKFIHILKSTTIGTNIFDRDWDILVLLDACRVDALSAVAPEYEFLSGIDSLQSVGGHSSESIAKTFVDEYEAEIRNTAYLSANVYTHQILKSHHHNPVSTRKDRTYKLLAKAPTVDVSTLGRIEHLYQFEPVGEVWPYGLVDGGTPPRYVTARGIAVGRTKQFDRLILHYLQPHTPFTATAHREDRDLHRYEYDWWG